MLSVFAFRGKADPLAEVMVVAGASSWAGGGGLSFGPAAMPGRTVVILST